MRRFIQLINSAMAALICTLTLAVVTILFLMFTSGKNFRGKRTGLFDGVFFAVFHGENDSLILRIGVNNMIPLVVTWAVFTAMIFMGYTFFKLVSSYKNSLETPQNDQSIS